jgi:hypothetical protein
VFGEQLELAASDANAVSKLEHAGQKVIGTTEDVNRTTIQTDIESNMCALYAAAGNRTIQDVLDETEDSMEDIFTTNILKSVHATVADIYRCMCNPLLLTLNYDNQ